MHRWVSKIVVKRQSALDLSVTNAVSKQKLNVKTGFLLFKKSLLIRISAGAEGLSDNQIKTTP